MFEQVLSGFIDSTHAQDALTALQKQGVPLEQAKEVLAHAVTAAADSMKKVTSNHPEPAKGLFDILGGHAGRSFLEGMVAGLVRGDGLKGSVEDGGMGVIGGHVAEVIGTRTGIDSSRASMIASAATPFIAHFVHRKLSERY